MNNPHILCAAPVSSRHSYIIDKYIEGVRNFTYPNLDFLLVDISEKRWDYLDKFDNLRVVRLEKMSEYVFETLVHARNKIREIVLNEGYDYWLSLDTDEIIPPDSIDRLLSHGKDLTGFLCFRGDPRRPFTLKSGWLMKDGVGKLDTYSLNEVMSWKGLVEVYSTGMSPLLISRKVLAKTWFVYVDWLPTTEDILFFIFCNDNGFKFYLDTDVISEHYNTEWTGKKHPVLEKWSKYQ